VLVRARGTVAAATTRTLGRSRASTSPSIPGRLGAGGEPAGAHVTAAFGLVSLLGRQAGVFVHDRYWEAGWTCDDWIREESDFVGNTRYRDTLETQGKYPLLERDVQSRGSVGRYCSSSSRRGEE
jgi:hypothetical protein